MDGKLLLTALLVVARDANIVASILIFGTITFQILVRVRAPAKGIG